MQSLTATENDLHITDPMEPTIDPTRSGVVLALRFIRDPRDIPFLKLMALMTLVLFPCAIYLYLPHRFSWALALPYWFIDFALFLAPFTLMLHNTSHRRLFNKKWEFMNQYIPTVLGPLMGQSPGTYYAHHVGMHHPENNLEPDLSTTMHLQRDSLIDFLGYYGRFVTRGSYDLVLYFRRNQRPRLARQVITGEFGWLLLVVIGCAISWRATVVVLIVPLYFVRFLMLAGNWGQHAFIDAEAPENCYRNSITCINCSYNRRAFNDGYHIGHHLSATRHFTDMPRDLLDTREQYVKERAIVFQGVDFFMVWLFLMAKKYHWLARRFVPLDGRKWSEDEIITLLRSRTQRIVPAGEVTTVAPAAA